MRAEGAAVLDQLDDLKRDCAALASALALRITRIALGGE